VRQQETTVGVTKCER